VEAAGLECQPTVGSTARPPSAETTLSKGI